MWPLLWLFACSNAPEAMDSADTDVTSTDSDSSSTDTPAEIDTDPPEPTVDPCEDVTCGANATCNPEHGDCLCDEGYTGDPNAGCVPVAAVEGWIGSPCASNADCDYDDGYCLLDADGFPHGYCSLECSRTCPDADGAPVTFCTEIGVLEGGQCVSRCDVEVYPGTGCRPDYLCVVQPRYGEETRVEPVCVPEEHLPDDPCIHPTNFAQNDDCYLELVSYGDSTLMGYVEDLIAGTADADTARAFLDLNFDRSQDFILDDLGVSEIHPNYTPGHSSSSPMRGMIVHYTAAKTEGGTIRYFVSDDPHASTHFILGSYRNGLIVQLFSHKDRSWHAGSTYNIDRFGMDFANAGYLDETDSGFEDYIGIDYDLELPVFGNEPVYIPDGIPSSGSSKYGSYDYWQPYTYYQILSWIIVTRALDLVYDLDLAAIERHGDVASSRVDPGPALPLTAMIALVETDDDLLAVDWLNAYKWDAAWITEHPEAR